MHKLIKYLKPFIWLIVASIILLFAQALSDLTLPDYMSDIVNKGIQQGGIVNAVPQAVRKSMMEKLILFMNADERTEVLESYTLVDRSRTDYAEYVDEYPALSKEPVYVRANFDKSKAEKLNKIMGKALIAVSWIERIKSEVKSGVISFNGMKIPASADIYAIIAKLPPEQITKMVDLMEKKFSALGDNMITQAAAPLVKKEYEALGMDTDKIQSRYIINTGIKMVLLSLISAACTVLVGFLSARTAAGLARDLRKQVFTKVEGFSNAEFDKFSTASLITRTTNDITQIQMFTNIMIRMLFYAPIMGMGGVIKAVGKSSSMSWIIALAVIVLLGLVFVLFSIAMPKFKLMQKLVDRLNLVTRENLAGMMVIRAFNTQNFEQERFDRANQELTSTSLFVNRVIVLAMPAMSLVLNGTTLLIVWVGAHQIAGSSMQVGDMMAFMQYAMQIIFSFLMISVMFIFLPRASVSAQRIVEVLETEPAIKDPVNPKGFDESQKGVVEFRNVYFRYQGAEEDVLKNISFKALPGQTTAIIGPTGAGKTTLMNLVLRFYDVTGGQVLVDGTDVRDVRLHELRAKIGYVPQKASLFSGTIASNIKYADENISPDEMEKAAEIAQAMDFINEKEKRFEDAIAQEGANVSGGQKQRLSIARAIVKKPEIYLFDDCFSALDFKTDAALRKALREQTGSSTVIIVAQRISTIMNAEQIIVLDGGRIVGKGTHEQLMKECPAYQEIAFSQLSKEELA